MIEPASLISDDGNNQNGNRPTRSRRKRPLDKSQPESMQIEQKKRLKKAPSYLKDHLYLKD